MHRLLPVIALLLGIGSPGFAATLFSYGPGDHLGKLLPDSLDHVRHKRTGIGRHRPGRRNWLDLF